MKEKLRIEIKENIVEHVKKLPIQHEGSIQSGDEWMKKHPENAPHIRILDDGMQIIY